MSIKAIERLTNFRINKAKRNGRIQYEHLVRVRALRYIDYPGGIWRNKEDRPTKKISYLSGENLILKERNLSARLIQG